MRCSHGPLALALALFVLPALGCSSTSEHGDQTGGSGGGAANTIQGTGGSGGAAAPSGTGGGGSMQPAATGGSAAPPGTGGRGAMPPANDDDAAVPDTRPDAATDDTTSPTGTFPAVTDLSGDGPFMAVTENNTGPSNGYTLYYPKELAPNGVLNPIVTWGNGALTSPVDYDYLLPHLATHGFVVIAANDTMVTGAEIRAGLDWLVQQNDASSSPLYKKLDVDNAAGVGYSLGGLGTYEAADDPRYVTIVIISGANMSADTRSMNVPKLHTPTAYLCTDDDASRGNCQGDYDVVTVPAFFGVLNGSVHTSVTEFLGLGDPAIERRLAGAVTGWLRWQQMADKSRKPMFLGDTCELCQDSSWTVAAQKNWK